MVWWRMVWFMMVGLQGGWGLVGEVGDDFGKVDWGKVVESIECYVKKFGIFFVGIGELGEVLSSMILFVLEGLSYGNMEYGLECGNGRKSEGQSRGCYKYLKRFLQVGMKVFDL